MMASPSWGGVPTSHHSPVRRRSKVIQAAHTDVGASHPTSLQVLVQVNGTAENSPATAILVCTSANQWFRIFRGISSASSEECFLLLLLLLLQGGGPGLGMADLPILKRFCWFTVLVHVFVRAPTHACVPAAIGSIPVHMHLLKASTLMSTYAMVKKKSKLDKKSVLHLKFVSAHNIQFWFLFVFNNITLFLVKQTETWQWGIEYNIYLCPQPFVWSDGKLLFFFI